VPAEYFVGGKDRRYAFNHLFLKGVCAMKIKKGRDGRTLIGRRTFLKGMGAAGAAVMLPPVFGKPAVAESRKKTLVIAAPSTPQSLDNEFDVSLGTIDVIGCIYDRLVVYPKIPDARVPTVMREDTAVYPDKPYNVNLVGQLAEKWEVSPDWKVARFFLRKGVKSNWGNELTAEDVKWTWDRKYHLGGLGRFMRAALRLERLDQVKVDGRYVVSFHLDTASPIILRQHCNHAQMIYDSKKSAEVGGKDDQWATKFLANESAGFGPYRISKLVRGQQAVFEARDDYHGGKPYMEKVIFKEMPTSAARMTLLQGGAVDIALFLQPLEYIRLKKVKGVTVDTVPATYMIWIELNNKMPPFDNVKVRQAMNYAFPREEVIRTIYQNLSDPLIGCMPNIYPGFNGSFWRYDTDLAKAKELLKEAGFGDGFKTTLSYNAGEPVHETISILYQTFLRDIGVDITLKKLPAATFYDHVTKRTEPMIYYSDSPWVPDPGYSTNLYFHSESYVDYCNYKNEEVDRLIRKGMETIDPGERKAIYDRVQEIVMDEAPWMFIAYPNYTLAHRSDVKGFTYYVSNNIRFQDFYRKA